MKSPRSFFTRESAAKMLLTSTRQVDRWIALGRRSSGTDGIYPVYQLGTRQIRIPADALDRFLERSKV